MITNTLLLLKHSHYFGDALQFVVDKSHHTDRNDLCDDENLYVLVFAALSGCPHKCTEEVLWPKVKLKVLYFNFFIYERI